MRHSGVSARVISKSVWRELVPFARTVALAPRRELDRPASAHGAGDGGREHRHQTSARHVAAGPSLRAPATADRSEKDGMRIFSPEAELIACSPRFFINHSTDVRAVLPMLRDASPLLERLLNGGHTVVAGRLAGAFRNIGRGQIADEILRTMAAAGYDARENDPFADKPALVFAARETSPYVNRIRLLWEKMREPVIERFPKAPGVPKNIDAYMKRVNQAYVTDAYHSLSIEGYRVTLDLIERVRSGTWNPEANEGDREQRNAMAARGYWLAYQSVQQSVRRVVEGANAGTGAAEDHRT